MSWQGSVLTATVVVVAVGKNQEGFFFVFRRSFYIHKRGTLFSENIEGKKINGNE